MLLDVQAQNPEKKIFGSDRTGGSIHETQYAWYARIIKVIGLIIVS